MIDIKQACLRAFGQNFFAKVKLFVHEQRTLHERKLFEVVHAVEKFLLVLFEKLFVHDEAHGFEQHAVMVRQ